MVKFIVDNVDSLLESDESCFFTVNDIQTRRNVIPACSLCSLHLARTMACTNWEGMVPGKPGNAICAPMSKHLCGDVAKEPSRRCSPNLERGSPKVSTRVSRSRVNTPDYSLQVTASRLGFCDDTSPTENPPASGSPRGVCRSVAVATPSGSSGPKDGHKTETPRSGSTSPNGVRLLRRLSSSAFL
jgi:hypothetical protein